MGNHMGIEQKAPDLPDLLFSSFSKVDRNSLPLIEYPVALYSFWLLT